MDATNTILQPQFCISSLHMFLFLAKNTSTLTHSTNNNTCTRQSQTNSNTFTDKQQYIYKHSRCKRTLQTSAKNVWLSHGELACWDWGEHVHNYCVIDPILQIHMQTCNTMYVYVYIYIYIYIYIYYVSIAMFEETNVNTHRYMDNHAY